MVVFIFVFCLRVLSLHCKVEQFWILSFFSYLPRTPIRVWQIKLNGSIEAHKLRWSWLLVCRLDDVSTDGGTFGNGSKDGASTILGLPRNWKNYR